MKTELYFKNLIKHFSKKENLYFFTIILAIFVLDRFTKNQVINYYNDNQIYFNNYLNIELIWNTGIGFGLFSTQSNVFYNSISLLIGIIIISLILFTIKQKKTDKLIFSLIIGGALGNFYDRIIFQGVPDFIDLHYKNFHWFTFNVADIFISLGIIFFIISGFSKNKDEKI